MATILFISDPEEGHLFPTFGLAASLQQRGHTIVYSSIADNEPLVKDLGFSFYPVMEDIFPRGSKVSLKKIGLLPPEEKPAHRKRLRLLHMQRVIGGGYDALFNDVKPDLVIAAFHLPFDILTFYYKYKISPVIINPILRLAERSMGVFSNEMIENYPEEEKNLLQGLLDELGIECASSKDLTDPLDKLPELITCPKEFDVDRPITPPNILYIEPSYRKTVYAVDVYREYGIPAHKKIIYAAMGSQAIRHGATCDVFFGKMISIMGEPEFSDMHLILCVGREYDTDNLDQSRENVTVLGWGPQIDILKVASAAVIHGGLGSIKECILCGVPMVVFPQAYDQPLNAKRVVNHHLGLAGEIDKITEEELKQHLLDVLHNPEIKSGIEEMQKKFLDVQKEQPGLKFIEERLEVLTAEHHRI